MGFRDKEDPVEEYLRAYASYVYIAWMQYLVLDVFVMKCNCSFLFIISLELKKKELRQ